MNTTRALVMIVASLTACSPAQQAEDPGAATGEGAANATPVEQPSATPTTSPPPTATSTATSTASAPGTSQPPTKMCTEMGCLSALTIPIAWGKDTLSAGKYKIELTVDGKKGQCEVQWPYKSCAEPRVPQCSGDVKFTLRTGCAKDGTSAKDMQIGPVQLDTTPAKTSLKIWRDKVMVHQQELTPKYEEMRPNGPGCEPVCQRGSLKVCIGTCTQAELDAAPTQVLPTR